MPQLFTQVLGKSHVVINDQVSATSLPPNESFATFASASFGEVVRGVFFTPGTTTR